MFFPEHLADLNSDSRGRKIRNVDTPASAQMAESPINTNIKSGGMRVEGRVTRPPKSTPTKHRSAAVMWYDEERQGMTKDNKEQQVLELWR